MIVLDTHIWIWWVSDSDRLSDAQRTSLAAGESSRIGICSISCWEIAKLVELRRLHLDRAVDEWLELALLYPGVQLLGLTPRIAVESTKLPGTFHRDPADQIIVATARVHDCPLLSSDGKVARYEHVETIS